MCASLSIKKSFEKEDAEAIVSQVSHQGFENCISPRLMEGLLKLFQEEGQDFRHAKMELTYKICIDKEAHDAGLPN